MKAFFILKKLIPSIVRGGKFQPIELLLKKKTHYIMAKILCLHIFSIRPSQLKNKVEILFGKTFI